MSTGEWRRRDPTVRARRRSPAPPQSSTHLVGLAVDRDPLSPHLVRRRRGGIAIGRDLVANRNDLLAGATARHAGRWRQRHCPDLARVAHRDGGMWVLVF